ncbi:MAG: MFS transporter [Desulfuromonas sp.]|mgnify:CR=1 FL=1|nr:MAG: MFS transporter [Desulfuromonas sp.]
MKLYTPAFIALFFANLAHVASFGAFFLFPLYITGHGGTSQDIGIIMGAFSLASALLRPWVANMIDRLGPKHSYSIGCGILAVMPLTHLWCIGPIQDYYPLLLLIRVVHGIGLAICFTAVFTFVIDFIPVARLNEGIGIFGSSGLVGIALGPLVTEPFIKLYGETALFFVAALLATLAFLFQLPVRPPCQRSIDHAATPGFFSLLRTRKLFICACLSLLFGIGLAATGNFIAPYAEEKQLSFISLYYLAYSCAAIAVRFTLGRLADRIGENRIIPWGLMIAAGGLLFTPLVNGNILLLVVGFIFGIGHGLLFPSLNSMAIRGVPYAIRGKITGIFTGGIDSGVFLGALVLGVIGRAYGFTILFLCAGVLILSGLLLFRLAPRQMSKTAQIGQ